MALENGENSGGGKTNSETDSKFFDIDYDGLVSLKPEYRGDSTSTSVPYAVSDNGVGLEGSKIDELPTKLIIPKKIGDTAVTGFQKAVFYHNKRIKEIVLPKGIKELPQNFARESTLEAIFNTESLEKLGTSTFYATYITEGYFPNIIELGEGVFGKCMKLVNVDIGNELTEIPNRTFYVCLNLSNIYGGKNAITVGTYAFCYTYRLKNLSFASQLKSIGDRAFYKSRVDYDWSTLSDCTFGTYATWNQYNSENYWGDCTYTACENELLTTFCQHDPEWVNEKIGNTERTYKDGCVMCCIAEIYSAFEKVELSSPKDFENVLNDLDSSLLDLDTSYYTNAQTVLEALGYEVTYYSAMTQQVLQEIYDSLADGALAIKAEAVFSNKDGGHAVVAYGVNGIGELILSDSGTTLNEIDLYENLKYSMQSHTLGSSSCGAIIVKKP